jgi:hypothetical protein
MLQQLASEVCEATCAAVYVDGVGVGGVGVVSDTTTETLEEFEVFPALSRARALNVCVPLLTDVVFHEIEYGELVSSLIKFEPSSKN